MTNIINELGKQIRIEIEHAERQCPDRIDVAMYHIDRAKKQLAEMEREVFLINRRSGEVK